ncbi:hypothetical protein ACSQ67_025835 [Phaseolus vulgaris]
MDLSHQQHTGGYFSGFKHSFVKYPTKNKEIETFLKFRKKKQPMTSEGGPSLRKPPRPPPPRPNPPLPQPPPSRPPLKLPPSRPLLKPPSRPLLKPPSRPLLKPPSHPRF